MPLYEYECDACDHRFEIIQKFSDPLIDKCPVCGGSVHKLQSAPAFQFRGSGWYVTDYAKKGQQKEAKGDGGPPDAQKDKTEKGEKADKADKADKSEKTEKSDSSAKPSASANKSNAASAPD